MEAVAAIGLTAAIWELTSGSSKVLKRLREYSKNEPSQLTDLASLLKVFDHGLDDIWAKAPATIEDPERKAALEQVINGCRRQVGALRDIVQKLQSPQSDSFFRRAYKGIRSVQKEKEIHQIEVRLQSYISVLNTFAGSGPSPLLPVPDVPSKEGPPSGIYDVPLAAAGKFVGRSVALQLIDCAFEHDQFKVVVLSGLGGLGKTQLAIEYTKHVRSRWSVFWVDFSSVAAALVGLERIYGLLAGTPKSFASVDDALTEIYAITGDGETLVVVDNFDNPTLFPRFSTYLSSIPTVRFLVTSRRTELQSLGRVLLVAPMSDDEGESLLTSLTFNYTPPSAEERECAVQISRTLGGLPLAIEQAAAYIRGRNLPLREFIHHFEARKAHILKLVPTASSYKEDLSVFATWELSLTQLGAAGEREPYVRLLTAAAFLGPAFIPDVLFQCYWETRGEEASWLGMFAPENKWDAFAFQDGIALLYGASLFQNLDIADKTFRFSLHPLVREWLQLRAPATEKLPRQIETLAMLSVFCEKHRNVWLLSEQLRQDVVAHLDACCRPEILSICDRPELSNHLFNCARFYYRSYKYRKAKPIFLSLVESHQLPEAQRILAVTGLSNCYCEDLEFERAEKLGLDIQNIMISNNGEFTKEKIQALMGLSASLLNESRFSEAEEMLQEPIRYLEKHSDRETASHLPHAREKFAMALAGQGRRDEAQSALKAAIAEYGGIEPVDHSGVTRCKARLAYQNLQAGGTGEVAEARQLLDECLAETGPARLSSLDPYTRITVYAVRAAQHTCESNHERAKEAGLRAYRLCVEHHGAEELLTLRNAANFVRFCFRCGAYDEGAPVLEGMLALVATGRLGPESEVELRARHLEGDSHMERGEATEAETAYRRLLALCQRHEGSNAGTTVAAAQHNVGRALWLQKRYREARSLFAAAVEGHTQDEGPDNERAADSRAWMEDIDRLIGEEEANEQEGENGDEKKEEQKEEEQKKEEQEEDEQKPEGQTTEVERAREQNEDIEEENEALAKLSPLLELEPS